MVGGRKRAGEFRLIRRPEMCASDYTTPKPRFDRLPRVRVEVPLKEMSDLYRLVVGLQRVLREGNPDRKDELLRRGLFEVSDTLNGWSGEFLAPPHV